MLTVLSIRPLRQADGHQIYKALCRCSCGSEKEIFLDAVRKNRTRSCGCDKTGYLKVTGKKHFRFTGHEEIRGSFWVRAQKGAATRGHVFDITIEYAWDLFVKQNRRCALSGVSLSFGKVQSLDTTASMDRIDNAKGYVEGNLQWVHKVVNRMRNTTTVLEFVEWCRTITEHVKDPQPVSCLNDDA